MGNAKLQPYLALRIISVGVFCVVLLAVALSFLTRTKRQVQVPEITKDLDEQKIDKKERVEFREMNKDRETSEVLADRHYIGEDNLYHLEGHVKISLFNRSEGETSSSREKKSFMIQSGPIFGLEERRKANSKTLS
jgi:hypothetical protein